MLFTPIFDSNAQSRQGDLGLKTVVIDPGHGGKDPGALGKTKATSEKHIVLKVSKLLGEKIKKEYPDVKVIYTRESDVFIGLHERAMTARRNNADLFISIHCNSSSAKSAYGTSVHILGQRSDNSKNKTDYFERNMSVAQQENAVIILEDDYKTKYQNYDPNSPESFISHKLQWTAFYESSLLFASEVVDHLIKAPLRPRKAVIDQDIFQVLVETNMPSVLLELAFISNASEYEYLASAKGQEEIAQRLFEAFKSYKSKYDASMKMESFPAVAAVPDEAAAAALADAVKNALAAASAESGSDEVWYGIQIMGLGRKIATGDKAFKGLDVTAVKSQESTVYKYITAKSENADEAKKSLAAVRKKFPEAFVVKVVGNEVSRVR
ncbi:MAG: N-acetylmuramoyl-L-alanine amidase [Bacteroidales bacterium]|nr:N-acetylmuramoyl-L-alanine amidase [Bacteroidales bacterium]MBQ9722870.1 N-acetylmuramoyl-L-alanine amidase [Bacteroidales bacterium]